MKNDKKTSVGQRLARFFKGFFTKNLAIKIISLIFAMLLWGYVMMETNPSRIKTISNVPVSFNGEDALLSKNLTVRGDRSEILPNITVEVSTNLTKYSSLDAASISAYVSLASISKPDTYRLRINVACSEGTVVSWSPKEVLLEVDELAARTVPIEVSYTGDLPEDYWRGEPSLSTQTLVVRGAAEDVARVVKAVCPINLTERTTSYNESVGLILVDAAGEEVSSGLFLDTVPSVVVKMDVLKTLTLPVDAEGALLGTDALPANYEVVSVITTPASVRVAGSEAALEGLTSISPEPLDISGSNASVQETLLLDIPEGITLLDDPEVNVYVDIREKTEDRAFTDMSISVLNLDNKMEASLSQAVCDVTISGRLSLVRRLNRGDVTLYVDAEGLAAGVYQVPIMVRLPSGDTTNELSYILSTETVTLTIQE